MLVQDARRVARKAWSIKFALASSVLSAAEVAIPYFAPSAPSGLFALGAMLLGLAAAVARIVAQKELHRG